MDICDNSVLLKEIPLTLYHRFLKFASIVTSWRLSPEGWKWGLLSTLRPANRGTFRQACILNGGTFGIQALIILMK